MKRRGFAYVVLLSTVVVFGGAAGMFAIEKGNQQQRWLPSLLEGMQRRKTLQWQEARRLMSLKK